MNGEKLIDALEFIDDDMIECVNVLRKYPDRHKHLWVNYVAVAACVALAIFGGFNYLNGNVSTENSSNNGSTNNTYGPQNDVADKFGTAENQNEGADQSSSDNNSSIRDETGGNTGSTSNIGSSTDISWHNSPVYMEITEISENSFKGRVIERVTFGGKVHFIENQIVTVIYRENTNTDYDTLLIKDLKVGDKVYVIYGNPDDTIYTSYIRYDDKF